jgi:hypothetical protein
VTIPEADLVEVYLNGLPVPIWARAQEHFQDLMREFALIAASSGSSVHPVPARLLELVDALTVEYAGLNDAQEQQLADAAAAGESTIDLVFRVPPQAAEAAAALGSVLDEADEFCRQGEHLLTLATPEDCLAYRRWYIAQFVDQLAGKPPVAWADWDGSGDPVG